MGVISLFERHLLPTLCLSALLVVLASAGPATDVGFTNFVQGLNDIETKLGKPLYNKNSNAIVCAPSAQILLGLLYAGARGKTANQLESLFGVSSKQLDTLNYFQKYVAELGVPEIKIANTAYLAKDLALKEEFVSQAIKYFNVTINKADFKKKAESAKNINAWVESKTDNLIKDFISPDDISDEAKLILINAIYFKANWKNKFEKYATKDGKFKVTATKEILVKHMEQTEYFPYAEDADYQYLVLPYEGERLSMLIVLPKNHEVFEKKSLSKSQLKAVKFESQRVKVVLPKFKFETKTNWIDLLKDKIPSAFSPAAELGGISDVPLFVSKMFQKAFIEVDENGTKAAAVTEVIYELGSAPNPMEPKSFVVNRPFYYAIEVRSDSVHTFLFEGAVVKPSF